MFLSILLLYYIYHWWWVVVGGDGWWWVVVDGGGWVVVVCGVWRPLEIAGDHRGQFPRTDFVPVSAI